MISHEERMEPDRYYREFHATFSEYLARYMFASRFVSGTGVVLDLGCGCGYGTVSLNEAPGRLVMGLDRSGEAVRFAKRRYDDHGVRFITGHAAEIPLQAESVDAVVSLEMIEHVRDAATVVSEACRILRRRGVFIVSTPNRLITESGSDGAPLNPFHVKEYSPSEFRELLGKNFQRVAIYGQRLNQSFLTHRENMSRIWNNQSLLHGEIHAVRSRLTLDERWTGVWWLKRAIRRLAGRETHDSEFNQSFRHGEYVSSAGGDWEIAPYDVDQATVLVAVCRKST